MADRATIKTSALRYLATRTDDPAYTDAILDPTVQEAVNSLITDINEQNPSYNSTTVTLTADSTASRLHTFSTQTVPLTDFSRWLEVRRIDSQGIELIEVRYDELRDAGRDHFVLTGIDSAAVMETSPDSPAGEDVFLRYTQWPVDLVDDTDVPAGIPLKFHDVIALEMLFAFALGGEQPFPRTLYDRWFDRRNQLIHHVGRRGAQPQRTKIYAEQGLF